MLRAVYMAMGDLAARAGDPNAADPFYRCMAKFDAYRVQVIAEESDRWVILVRVHVERCADAGSSELMDAAATYEVSKTDFRILSAKFGAG